MNRAIPTAAEAPPVAGATMTPGQREADAAALSDGVRGLLALRPGAGIESEASEIDRAPG